MAIYKPSRIMTKTEKENILNLLLHQEEENVNLAIQILYGFELDDEILSVIIYWFIFKPYITGEIWDALFKLCEEKAPIEFYYKLKQVIGKSYYPRNYPIELRLSYLRQFTEVIKINKYWFIN